jgi:hypothetical protein
MNYQIISILLGITLKLTDDFIDLSLGNSLSIEFLKGLTICLQTLNGYDDILYNVFTLAFFLGSYFTGGLDCDYWKSLCFICFFILLVSLKSLDSIKENAESICYVILLILSGFLASYGEATYFTEESSDKKIIFRFIMGITLLFLPNWEEYRTIFETYVKNPIFYYKILLFCGGYFLTSSLLLCYSQMQ